MTPRPRDGLKRCTCGDPDCVVKFKGDDTDKWLREVAQAEASVREWLMGLQHTSGWKP